MSKPLFVLQSLCKERLNCRECRDPNTDLYRKGWAERYAMPAGWPACPYGIPMGEIKETPPPPPNHLLQMILDQPESGEAKEAWEVIRARADIARPVCLACPGGYNLGILESGLEVDCSVGQRCCSGELSRGRVHYGTGFCTQGYWK